MKVAGRGPLAALLATLLLAGCAGLGKQATAPAGGPDTSPARTEPHGTALSAARAAADYADLPGWAEEDHAAALAALQQGCGAARDRALAAACIKARAAGPLPDPLARLFLEQTYRPVRLPDDGLLTAYFSPEYAASPVRTALYAAPVLGRPSDLVVQDGAVLRAGAAGRAPYPDRAAIETAPRPPAPVLAWMRAEDLFFLQIQGSGVLTLPDGRRLEAAVAATNGRPFVGLAKLMREDGLLADRDTSGEAIRRWLAEHRGPEADAQMRRNPRYVFFALKPDDGVAPAGSAGVPLPTGRAVAVDPAFHSWGAPLWLDGVAPALAGAFPAYRRLVVALDSGGAIMGPVRADLYLGQGAAAGVEAGRVRHTLRLWHLVPRPEFAR